MRFRAVIERDYLFNLFAISSSIEKIGQSCVIILNEDFIRISLMPLNLDSIRCFCEVQANNLFSEYRINSNNSNSIMFQININHLTKALMSGKSAIESILKLVKRSDSPCLCFEAKASGGLTVDIIHDIPIKLMKVEDIIHYMPPQTSPPKVALQLSKVKHIRTIVEKMIKFTKSIEITVSQLGRLSLKSHTPGMCTISTYVNGLLPQYESNLNIETDQNNTATVSIDIKKFSTILNASQILTHSALLCKYAWCKAYIMRRQTYVYSYFFYFI
jgi:hypothetical protein